MEETLWEWSPALPTPPDAATPRIQEMVNKLKPQLEEKLHIELGAIQALYFYSRLRVEVTDYLIQVSSTLI